MSRQPGVVLSVAAACGVLVAGLAGCAGSSAGSPPSGSPTSTASAVAAAKPPAGPLDGLSADAITTRAFANLTAASSVRFTGWMKDTDGTLTMDITVAKGRGCEGTMSMIGKGSFQVRIVGRAAWFKADRSFWKSAGGSDGALLDLFVRKWIALPKNSGLSQLTNLCTLNTALPKAAGPVGGIMKSSKTTIAGQPVLKLTELGDNAAIYVSIAASPQLIRISDPQDGGYFNFSRYNAPVRLSLPPASQVLDGSKYGM